MAVAKEDLCITIYDPTGQSYGFMRIASRGGTGSGERIKNMLNVCLMDGFEAKLVTEVPSRFTPSPDPQDMPSKPHPDERNLNEQ